VDGAAFTTGWSFGPSDADAKPVSWVADALARSWGDGACWRQDTAVHPEEARLPKLDASRLKPAWVGIPFYLCTTLSIGLSSGIAPSGRVATCSALLGRKSSATRLSPAGHAAACCAACSSARVAYSSASDEATPLEESLGICQLCTISSFWGRAWQGSAPRTASMPKASPR
jgi:hypothetical protein